MQANPSQLFTIERSSENYHKFQSIKFAITIEIFSRLHSSPLRRFLMFLLIIAADEALFIESGMLFHNMQPQNFIESMPNIMRFGAGICSTSRRVHYVTLLQHLILGLLAFSFNF